MKLFFSLSFLLISLIGFSQENWTLIYENDAEGNTVSGTLDELISVIRKGETVRIYFQMGRQNESNVYVEHTAQVQYFTIMNSPKGQWVTAQIDPIIGQIPDFEKEQVLLKENLEWSLIAATNGKNDTMTRNVITGEILGHQIHKWGTKWYVEKK